MYHYLAKSAIQLLRPFCRVGDTGRAEPFSSRVALKIVIYAPPSAGDLDNFVTGICDGLMATHPFTPITPALWSDLPAGAWASCPIVYTDDAVVQRIEAERRPLDGTAPRYEVEISGDRRHMLCFDVGWRRNGLTLTRSELPRGSHVQGLASRSAAVSIRGRGGSTNAAHRLRGRVASDAGSGHRYSFLTTMGR